MLCTLELVDTITVHSGCTLQSHATCTLHVHILTYVYVIIEYVRLIGARGLPYEGRVEVYLNEQWGTVCDDYFDIEDADVVCKHIGYPRAIDYYTKALGSGPIWLDDLNCTGRETSVFECIYADFNNINCGHKEDVGVLCQGIA